MQTLIKKLRHWLGLRGSNSPTSNAISTASSDSDFYTVQFIDKTPPNDEVLEGQFLVVVHKENLYWTIFRCPCGCDEVISLAMKPPHKPRWSLEVGRESKPTLFPSVWRNAGCMSHFWVRNGRVEWCRDSGREPWKVRPDLYKRR